MKTHCGFARKGEQIYGDEVTLESAGMNGFSNIPFQVVKNNLTWLCDMGAVLLVWP